ncbi:MAG: hypothetical protein IAF94_26110, partial [Pirellulaceae bacterium]|nr:hypothetical protein [Pirellulaceae bacterium]
MRSLPSIALVTHPTRLEGLRRRWGTLGQAKFRLKMAHEQEDVLRAGGAGPKTATLRTARQKQVRKPQQADFEEYRREDDVYRQVVDQLESDLQIGLPVKRVDRSFIANFDFGTCEVVVVVGQDGLVANTAKYVGSIPIVAVNPDPQRIDGVLLPFQVREAG